LTDLGGEFPITLSVSISMLSVLLVVNDSELDGTEGSMDARRGNSCLQLKMMSLYHKVVLVVGGKEGEPVEYESKVKREKCR
jgi:hypothetical protein